MKNFFLTAGFAVFLVCQPAAREAAFISPERSHAIDILPSPPTDGSDATKADLAELHRLESSRSADDIAKAKSDEGNQSIFLFKNVLGEKFIEQNLPLTAALNEHVRSDASDAIQWLKDMFHRVRPYNLDRTLHPVCKTGTKNDGYSSGHMTTGYLLALVPIDLVPERRDAIFARADEFAHNRLVCGVHHPSDLARAGTSPIPCMGQ